MSGVISCKRGADKYRARLAASSGVNSHTPFQSEYGARILLKYGWEQGKGLGRRANGRTDCLQATRREMKAGLGAEKRKAEGEAQWDNWWADCFNDVAAKISVETPAGQSSDDSSDEEGPQMGESGRITSVKKAGAMAGKLRRVLRQEAPLRG
jgi:hypothetical protein